ncbi:MAG: hypothetical protein IT373_02975 [Polyangiaceae bacterium]|nr:hypothetical protein [Polyangiaceae bacterium]
MSKKKDHPRRNAETRLASRVLEGLMASADDELEEFREWRVGKESTLELAHLRRARELLDRIAAVIQSGDARAWKELDGAWRILVDGADARRVAAELGRSEASAEARPAAASQASELGASARAADTPAPKSASPPEALANLPAPPALLCAPAVADQPSSTPRPPPVLGNTPRAGAARAASPWASGQSPASQAPVPLAPAPAPAFTAATPAAPAAHAPRVTASAQAAGLPASIDIDETQGVDGRALLLEVLPFKGEAAAPVPGAGLADLPPLPAGDLDATGFMAAPILVEGTLPFAGSFSLRKELASAAALAAPGARGPARPVDPPEVAHPSATPAVSGASGAPVVELTIDQYASLCARCDVYKERTQEIERAFGIGSAEARRALTAHWVARLTSDRAVFSEFNARFHEYHAWLAAERRRGSGA